MKSRPMLYQGAMVRAILDDIKTQTRRIVKPSMNLEQRDSTGFSYTDKKGQRWMCGVGSSSAETMRNFTRQHSPYGQPGDRLWVRETCRAEELSSGLDGVRYLADEAFQPIENTVIAADLWCRLRDYGKRASPVAPIKTVPAIHMPRWASRIELEITGIRVERLQDISRGDAMAEGCPFPNMADGQDPRFWYANLWAEINGSESWAANPYVWCIEFKKVKP